MYDGCEKNNIHGKNEFIIKKVFFCYFFHETKKFHIQRKKCKKCKKKLINFSFLNNLIFKNKLTYNILQMVCVVYIQYMYARTCVCVCCNCCETKHVKYVNCINIISLS